MTVGTRRTAFTRGNRTGWCSCTPSQCPNPGPSRIQSEVAHNNGNVNEEVRKTSNLRFPPFLCVIGGEERPARFWNSCLPKIGSPFGIILGNIILAGWYHARPPMGIVCKKGSSKCYSTKVSKQCTKPNPWVVFLRTHKGKFANKDDMLASYRADFQEKMARRLSRVEEKSWTKKRKKGVSQNSLCLFPKTPKESKEGYEENHGGDKPSGGQGIAKDWHPRIFVGDKENQDAIGKTEKGC
ncbi:unnamed protein product [Ectocarpus sp. 12 AP-2014]